MTITCRQCQTINPPTAHYCSACRLPLGTATGAPGTPPLASGAILDNRYRIVQELGGGAMGRVYLAEDRRFNGLRCAVKEMIDPSADPAKHQEAVRRFEDEATMLRTLSHPHIPRVSDHFTEGARSYLVMDYVEGETLDAALKRQNGPLPEAQVLRWADQLLGVLAYLHGHQPAIVFRDLKPPNIMRRPDDSVVVIDFGIAQHFNPQRQGTVIGTPGYAAPEQYLGRAEPRSDLYGLGATLHHLLTGSDPQSRTYFDFPPVRRLNPLVSEATERTLVRALERDLSQRFATADEMRQALGITLAPVAAQPPRVTQALGPAQTLPLASPTARRLIGHQGAVTGAVFSHQGNSLVTVGADGFMVVWEVINGSARLSVSLSQAARACGLTPDDATALVAGDNGAVEFIACADGTPRTGLTLEYIRLRSLALASDGRLVAAAGRYAPMGIAPSGEIWLWDTQTLQRHALMSHAAPICSLAFRPDGAMLLAGDSEGHIGLWSVGKRGSWSKTGELASSLKGAYVACSPDNQGVAAVGADGRLIVWHIDRQQLTFDTGPARHLAIVRDQGMPPPAAVVYSPDGRSLAYTAPGQPVRRLFLLSGQIDDVGNGRDFTCLAFSPDGLTLAAGARDGSVWLWPVM